nr:reverse transcriptase domain-containing protein [Tanacetum cinerariifolium]
MQKLETELWNHAMVEAGQAMYTGRFHELARLVPHLVTPESKRIGRYVYGLALQIQGMEWDNQKEPEMKGNIEEPSKDRNGREDNKKTRTGMSLVRPVVPGNVNPINAKNPVARTYFECGSTDHIKSACPSINQAHRLEGNQQNQVVAVNEGQGRRNQGNPARVLVGLLPHHEEGERVDEPVVVVAGLDVVLVIRVMVGMMVRVSKQVVKRHWIQLFSDYDCKIRYHPGKANVAADALSLDEMVELRNDGALYYLDQTWVPLKGDVRTLIIDEAYKSKYFVNPGVDKIERVKEREVTNCEEEAVESGKKRDQERRVHMSSTAELPLFRIQQYLQNEHYALWDVIKFGDSYKAPLEETGRGPASESSARKKGRTVAITTEDMQKRRNDVKARTTLLLALPDEYHHQKAKKNQLKLQYGNFKAKGSETLEQTFNRLQAIVSHLEFIDVEIEQDNLNQKFLTSLAPEWLMYTIVWRNRDDLDTMSLDDVGKGKVHTASVPTASIQVFTASTDFAAASLSHNTDCAYIATQSNGSQIKYEDITQIDEDDIEEMDIKWNMALLGMRANRAPRSQDRGKRESYKQGPKEEEPAPKALIAIDGIGWD